MYKNLTGQKFYNLLVLGVHGKTKQRRILWKCLCDCGNHTIVSTSDLVRGHTKSCGCYNNAMRSKTHKTHGESHTKLYKTWISLKRRCNNPKDTAYDKYGGRGIKVCDEWLHSFITFKEWAMSNGYNSCLSIDRIDVNGDYSPSNCRWTNDIIQARNRRNTVYVTYHGETASLEEMCQKLDVNVNTIRSRINKYGHTFESAVDEFEHTGRYVQYKIPKAKLF